MIPSVLSVSWGWDENQPFNGSNILWSAAAIDHVNQSLLAVAQLGVTVCVSTGDDGSEAQVKDGNAHVNFPATSPYVLAVGGTTLHAPKSKKGQVAVTEVVWNDGPGSGTGGGVSDITPVPSWQEGKVPRSVNAGNFAGRAIPDVAANADPATGYLTMSGGQLGIVGGTSASAPLWGSLIIRHQRADQRPRRQFQRAALRHDRPKRRPARHHRAATTTPTACSTASSPPGPAGTRAPAGASPTAPNCSRRCSRRQARPSSPVSVYAGSRGRTAPGAALALSDCVSRTGDLASAG